MGSHGCTGGFGVLLADGVVDAFVLAVHTLQVAQPAFGCALRGVEPGARNDHGAQVIHQVGKVLVAGCARHFHVKLKVRRHAVGVCADGILKSLQGAGHGLQVVVGAPLGCQTGGFCFQADAQLQHRDHVGQRGKVTGRDLEVGLVCRRQHKGADTVPGLDQAGGLQLGQRFTHHCAADIKAGHDFGLGGQFFSGLQLPVTDAGHQPLDDFVHQAAGPARPVHGKSRSGWLDLTTRCFH